MTKYTIRLTNPARADIKAIYSYSRIQHGVKTAKTYDALIIEALKHIKQNPLTPGSRDQSEIAENVRSYHIGLTQKNEKTQIKKPRHIIFYFTAVKDKIVVSRILHDARDHTLFMEDIRRDVMKEAKLPDKDNYPRDNGKKR